MLESHIVLWITTGFIFILLEISLVPGIGFLFAGLGAVTTGILLEFALIDHEFLSEIVSFAAFTALWAIILWIPLKHFSKKLPNESYQNIVGSVAYIHNKNLEPGEIGSVKWSGVVMQAKLADNYNETIMKDQRVIITNIKENILYVTKQ